MPATPGDVTLCATVPLCATVSSCAPKPDALGSKHCTTICPVLFLMLAPDMWSAIQLCKLDDACGAGNATEEALCR